MRPAASDALRAYQMSMEPWISTVREANSNSVEDFDSEEAGHLSVDANDFVDSPFCGEW
jgi:hypothetical protein